MDAALDEVSFGYSANQAGDVGLVAVQQAGKSPVLDGGCSRVPAIRLLRGELKEAITVTGCQRGHVV